MSKVQSFSALAASLILVAILASCAGETTGPTKPSARATATPSPSPTMAATMDQLIALGQQVFPSGPDATTQGATAYYSCGPYTNYPTCPLTPRLQARLQESRYWLCRACATGATSRDLTATPTASGGVIHAVMGSHSGGAEHFDLIVVNSGGQLLVDDETCTSGGPDTSIYKDAAGPGWACGGA